MWWLWEQEAAMIHNTPNCPILPSPTKNTVGPGAYNVLRPATTQEDMNFVMMPQHVRYTLLRTTTVELLKV
ncbi:hypothetical protein PybrP1_003027 [[Pythium] brassicae (nom. inval.)]|nr:hypothetical protein PybrP1_003027 [[Pythium] brassicae (nom. inval.)]